MHETTDLAGKRVFITGASKGLGRALALQLAGKGAHLVLVARDAVQLEAVAAQVRRHGVRGEPIPADLSRPQDIAAACALANADGGVDILVNNAGLGAYKPFLEHSLDEHDAIIDLNLRGLIHVTQRLLPAMLARGSGHIVNIASDVADRPIANMAVYAASKFAVRGFTLSLAREMRHQGIKVSLVNPGIIDTGFNGGTPGTKDAAWSLRADQLAALIVGVLEQPGYQLIDEVTVHPMMQDY